MRLVFFLVMLCGAVGAYGQCGREYPSGMWYTRPRILPSGDTINQLDKAGLCHGPHVLWLWNADVLSTDDSVTYLLGYFKHGQPKGEWLDHCGDGSYSLGEFASGAGRQYRDSTGALVLTKDGLYNKIGVWRYFKSDSSLVRTERYWHSKARRGGSKWRNRTDILAPDGRWVTTKFIRNGAGPYQSPTHERLEMEWEDDGTPIRSYNKRAHGSIRREFHVSGRLKSKSRCGWSPWYFHRRCVTRKYDEEGRLMEKKVVLRTEKPIPQPPREGDGNVF